MRDRLQELTGTDRITTDQGDYVGTVPDERYRSRILECFNSTREADLDDKIEDLESEIEDKDTEIDELESQVDDLEREVRELRAELAEADHMIRELQEQLQNHAD